MTVKTSSLVLYKNKGATVIDFSGEKYTIRTASGDNKSVRSKDIELLHPGPCVSVPAPAAIPDNLQQQEIAELMGDEPMPFAEAVELLLGEFSPANALAMIAILEKNCYFSGSASAGVKANPPEHVENCLAKEQLKNAQQMARCALLERIKNGQVTPEDHPFLREIELVAYGENSSSKLMHDLGMEALPEKAQDLLLKLGVWDEFANNPWPRRFAADITPLSLKLPEHLPDEPRTDMTSLIAYAIDDADSNDPDDAISFDPASELLWVHVADPGAVVTWDSDLETASCERGCTLYLPELVSPMLPENSIKQFGLGLNDRSPALSFGIYIAPNGVPTLEKIQLSTLHVERMNYQQAEELMEQDHFQPCIEALSRFRDMRIANNSVMIKLPEVKVKVDTLQKKIDIVPLHHSPARELVANAMMAAGHAVAKFAVEHDFAMPFSIQSDPEMTERPESIPGMYALRKSCRQSVLSTIPGKHAGLGLEPYCRVTSPLRRYEDLLGHIQLRKFIKHEEMLNALTMDERLACAEQAAILRGKLERQCREYWTLVMLKNSESPWQGEAVFVAKPDERSVWLINDLAYEFKNRYHSKLALGETVQVECIAANPALLTAQFKVLKTSTEAINPAIETPPE